MVYINVFVQYCLFIYVFVCTFLVAVSVVLPVIKLTLEYVGLFKKVKCKILDTK